jgi:sugar/nucleoside kinase (ribokinase family)
MRLYGAMLDFLAVGDVMLDVFTGSSADGEVHAGVRVRSGGSALNAAVWAASEGASAAVIGRIGSDAAATMLRSELAEVGVEPRLVVDRKLPTGTVVYTADGVIADRGATAGLAPSDLPPRLEAAAVLISGYALLHEDTRAAARAAIERARAEWIAIDVASVSLVERVGPARVLELAEGADVLLANEAEALALTGRAPPTAASELGRRFRIACVKRGRSGVIAAHEGRLFTAAAPYVPGGRGRLRGGAARRARARALARGRARARLPPRHRCGGFGLGACPRRHGVFPLDCAGRGMSARSRCTFGCASDTGHVRTGRVRLRPAPRDCYQPRVSSSSSGRSEAVEMPTIGSPRPVETRASTSASA